MFSKLWEIEDQGRNRQILQRQIRDLFFKAFSYLKSEVENDGPMHGVAVPQDRIVEGCDVDVKEVRTDHLGVTTL